MPGLVYLRRKPGASHGAHAGYLHCTDSMCIRLYYVDQRYLASVPFRHGLVLLNGLDRQASCPSARWTSLNYLSMRLSFQLLSSSLFRYAKRGRKVDVAGGDLSRALREPSSGFQYRGRQVQLFPTRKFLAAYPIKTKG